ncbi:MAG: hypothetical protein GWP59_04370, partial [Chlamydiales bacterium]|nr:hypothetical protein [Chlamydiales bacterium]
MSESAAVTSVTSSLLVYQRKTRQILEELKGSALTAGRLQSLINQLRGAIFISFEPQGKEELFQLRKLELISCKIEESLKLLPSPKGITASQHLALSLFKTALQPFLLSLKERKSHVSTRYKIPGRYSPRPFRLPKIT